MSQTETVHAIKGQTIQFVWTDGPTKGLTHEHQFHSDGTVEWHDVHPAEPSKVPSRPAERVPYSVFEVTPAVSALSYCATSGFTLTVVLNFDSGELVGFASGGKEWYPVRGTFNVVAPESSRI